MDTTRAALQEAPLLNDPPRESPEEAAARIARNAAATPVPTAKQGPGREL